MHYVKMMAIHVDRYDTRVDMPKAAFNFTDVGYDRNKAHGYIDSDVFAVKFWLTDFPRLIFVTLLLKCMRSRREDIGLKATSDATLILAANIDSYFRLNYFTLHF